MTRFIRALLQYYSPVMRGLFSTVFCIMTVAVPTKDILAEITAAEPEISIIIDDIGYRSRDDRRAIDLPGRIAYAIMPMSPNAQAMSRLAILHGKTVLLHLSMQSIHKDKNRFLGPGALRLDMNREQFMQTLTADLRSLPDAVGVNNHMGSLLTQNQGQMEWLMETLNDNNKFYIDSMTIKGSVAGKIAMENRVPCLRRDVFLDNKINSAYIRNQFEHLVELARLKGGAVAIGHPHPETIDVLMDYLSDLDRHGVTLISLPEMVRDRMDGKFMHHVSMSD